MQCVSNTLIQNGDIYSNVSQGVSKFVSRQTLKLGRLYTKEVRTTKFPTQCLTTDNRCQRNILHFRYKNSLVRDKHKSSPLLCRKPKNLFVTPMGKNAELLDVKEHAATFQGSLLLLLLYSDYIYSKLKVFDLLLGISQFSLSPCLFC
jgi:hypothetical protein